MKNQSCASCRFSTEPPINPQNVMASQGKRLCRRNPPAFVSFAIGGQIATGSGFPEIASTAWCGEYSPGLELEAVN